MLPFPLPLPPLDQTVVYEANLRAEGPTGGFAALTRRLDSIHALGVNVLWLMPVQPVGKERPAGPLGSPYAVADYDGVNPEFGTSAELRSLIDAAHARRMAVILDWVANHTAWDHPWVQAHPDWYTHDAEGRIVSPAGTNWNDVADLDYAKPELRAAMIRAMQGWVRRYGIDGFRCDTTDWVPEDFWRDTISRLRADSPRPLFMLAEGFRPENRAAGFDLEYGWPFHDGLVAVFKGAKATSLADSARKEAANGPSLRFVTNHDKAAWDGTPTEFFRSPEGVRAATAVTFLYGGGAPLVYSGQEVGWDQRIPILDRSAIVWSGGKNTRAWLTRLLALRAKHHVLQEGTTLDVSTDDVVAFVRKGDAEEAFVAANVRSEKANVTLPDGTWRDGFSGKSASGRFALPPYGVRVLFRATRPR